MKDIPMMSNDWIYKNIFNFSDEQIKSMESGMVDDQKQKFRFEQISVEGNDPVSSGDAVGTPSDMAAASPAPEGEAPPESLAGSMFNTDEGGSDEGGQPGAGRPKEGAKYSQDSSARGRDPIGRPLALAHFDALKKSLGKSSKEILKETKDIEDVSNEYEDFLNEK